jgi:hypothetical protein
MTKIEFFEFEENPDHTGWYLVEYDKLGEAPTDFVGPYDTKTAALRMWRDHKPEPSFDKNSGELSDAGHDGD